MNVLKKSTLALAIAGFASAASAATISPDLTGAYPDTDHWVLSKQGIEVGVTHDAAIKFDLKVENAHESRSEFDIVLPETIELDALALSTSNPLVLIEVENDSKYYILAGDAGGDNAAKVKGAKIAIRVGTGSFSIENAKYDADKNTLTLVSGVGQSLLAGSSVGIRIGSTATGSDFVPSTSGAADIVVNTYTDAREFIETADKTFATTADQFALALREGTSELVDRVDQTYFATEVFYNDDKVETSAAGQEDANVYELYRESKEGVIRISNDKDLVAKANLEAADITLYGDFSNVDNFKGHQGLFSFNNGGNSVAGTGTSTSAAAFAYPLTTAVNEDTVEEFDLRMNFTNAGVDVANLENEWDVAAKLEYSNGSLDGTTTAATKKAKNIVLDKTAFGEWVLDQAIINVPYMPVGYKAKGIDAVFEIANRGWADAAIKVKGFDQYGNVFPATDLVDAGKQENGGVASAQTIVKVSADDILATFGLEEGDQRKMNITFMIDANRADIDLVPYYNNNGGRTPIMNSQYKDGAERR
ncbi:hypothetical protein [Vibrio rotiferianus]|uniref:hypothetical protein n=1 Tax=Vibrio rotiferianus TaxID=190895 RepID=UPI001110E514|nr:hypothetical protein [Vibrio rotiferianus]TMX58626.1 hypothetical protein DA097_19980 [Vibrio rotiferianus]